MMKYLLLLLALCACSSAPRAQEKNLWTNLQLHRDVHRDLFTSTVEIFEQDRWGTTFFFTDFDFGSTGQQASYFEIARNFFVLRMRQAKWNLALQYNDGVLPTDAALGKGIPRTALGGIALSEIPLGPAAIELQALARQEFAADLGWQLTAVWYCPIRRTPLEFLGYVDVNSNQTGDQPNSLQAEPQLQYRRGPWAIGMELEISRNFTGAYTEKNGFAYHTWYTHPTVFLRVDF
ncbi:MAG: DUF5020 family protein [bacterium]|nr:DUF5020 family protein [bacterium]